MIVGTEWLVEAAGCDKAALRDEGKLRSILDKLIVDLGLRSVGAVWHKFDGEAGVTGLIALTESHIACHTYPEHGIATFNLYCCRTRPEWDWGSKLKTAIDATSVTVTKIERGCNAGVSPAVPSASRTRPFVKFGDVSIRNRGRLPHWESDEGIYFVTFRLADSLPAKVLARLETERKEMEQTVKSLSRELSHDEQRRMEWLFSQKVDEYLDANYGDCLFKQSELAAIVANAILHFDDIRYQLYAWCLMPNHGHIVFRPINRNKLPEIMHSWKSYTSHEINKILGKKGEIWQREYYDHLVRDESELNAIVRYILDNPIKAGLKEWKWVGSFCKLKTAQTSGK